MSIKKWEPAPVDGLPTPSVDVLSDRGRMMATVARLVEEQIKSAGSEAEAVRLRELGVKIMTACIRGDK